MQKRTINYHFHVLTQMHGNGIDMAEQSWRQKTPETHSLSIPYAAVCTHTQMLFHIYSIRACFRPGPALCSVAECVCVYNIPKFICINDNAAQCRFDYLQLREGLKCVYAYRTYVHWNGIENGRMGFGCMEPNRQTEHVIHQLGKSEWADERCKRTKRQQE